MQSRRENNMRKNLILMLANANGRPLCVEGRILSSTKRYQRQMFDGHGTTAPLLLRPMQI